MLSSFRPFGMSLILCMFVGLLETFSFVVRPIITCLRPVVNVGGGAEIFGATYRDAPL